MATFEDRESLSSVRSKINDAIVTLEGTNSFSRVSVAGQGNVDADGKNSTLNLEAGSNITITTNASTDTITISSTGGGGVGVTDGDKGDITVTGSGTVWTIDNGAVDLATKVSGTLPATSFDDTAHGSRAGGTLHAAATTSVAGFMSGADKTKLNGIATGANLYVHPNHTGDVTSVADGATTIAANAVTNAKLAQAVANTLKGNNTGSTANVADLTTSQVKTMLAITTADVSGLGTLATQSGTFSGTSSGTNTGDQLIFQTIAVSGQSNVVADTTADTLTLAAGTGTSITTNAATDTITFTNTAPDQVVVLTQGGTVTVSGSYPNFTISGAATNIAEGTRTTTTVPITSSTGTGATLSAATTSLAGVMTSADKTKLDGIAAGAQVNVATDLSYTASTRVLASSTGTDATLPLVSSTDAGLAPASGGGTTNFLRADGTWAAPAGGGPPSTAVFTKTTFTATAAQTTFTVGYNTLAVDVFLNGVKLTASEYTATSGTSIVLTTGAAANDVVEVVSFDNYDVTNFTSVFDKVRAYVNSSQTITSGSWVKILYDTTFYDTNSLWDSTNTRVIPKKAGYYMVTVRVRTNTAGGIAVAIGKNGSTYEPVGADISATTGQAGGGTGLVYCNGTTDYIEGFAILNTSRSVTTGTFDSYLEVLGPF